MSFDTILFKLFPDIPDVWRNRGFFNYNLDYTSEPPFYSLWGNQAIIYLPRSLPFSDISFPSIYMTMSFSCCPDTLVSNLYNDPIFFSVSINYFHNGFWTHIFTGTSVFKNTYEFESIYGRIYEGCCDNSIIPCKIRQYSTRVTYDDFRDNFNLLLSSLHDISSLPLQRLEDLDLFSNFPESSSCPSTTIPCTPGIVKYSFYEDNLLVDFGELITDETNPVLVIDSLLNSLPYDTSLISIFNHVNPSYLYTILYDRLPLTDCLNNYYLEIIFCNEVPDGSCPNLSCESLSPGVWLQACWNNPFDFEDLQTPIFDPIRIGDPDSLISNDLILYFIIEAAILAFPVLSWLDVKWSFGFNGIEISIINTPISFALKNCPCPPGSVWSSRFNSCIQNCELDECIDPLTLSCIDS